MLNAGNRRGMVIPRCVGEGNELRDFSIYGPKLLAGIGRLPDTIADRCVFILLKRKRADETPDKYRHRLVRPFAEALAEKMEIWGEQNVAKLGTTWP
jgi:hypothetical protein